MKRFILSQALIMIGTAIIAVAVNVFMVPGNINSGGVTGIALVMLKLFNIRISVVSLFINGILFIIAYRVLARAVLYKTLGGIIYLSFFLEITGFFPVYTGSIVVTTMMSGVLLGLGVGFIVREGASSGGSDFAAFILKHKFPHVSIPIIIMIIDCAVVAVSGIVIGNLEVTVFSFLTLYIAAKVSDSIMVMGKDARVLNIMSKKADTVADTVITKHRRGITGIYANGMFMKKEFMLLYCVVSPRELPSVLDTIKDIDPDSFVVISEAKEVWGNGFIMHANK